MAISNDYTIYNSAINNFNWTLSPEVESIQTCSVDPIVSCVNESIEAAIQLQEPMNEKFGKRHSITELFVIFRHALDTKYQTSTPEKINCAMDPEKALLHRTVKQMTVDATQEEVKIIRDAVLLFGIEKIKLLANPILNDNSFQIAELTKKLNQLNMFMRMISNDPSKSAMIPLVQNQINVVTADIQRLS